ncbi:hypothetical protein [Demequina soli]|uniref:hypothetical protein n=1 Tax=Demequina soli TaxID=1638987 RepID=UPI00078437DB|nr:hypothetical protein [Demequina soli]
MSRTLHDLEAMARAAADDAALATARTLAEARVARYRRGRASVVGAVAAVVGVLAVVGLTQSRPDGVAPAVASPTPGASASPSPSASAASDPAACAPATVIPGKAVGMWGGMESSWNSTPVAPCDEWPAELLAHPNTVLINTRDDTMVEAYYRVDGPDMDAWRDLGPDFLVPDPDAAWPADRWIVVDAATRELLEVDRIPDQVDDAAPVDLSTFSPGTQAVAAGLHHPALRLLAVGGFAYGDSSTAPGALGPVLLYRDADAYAAYLEDPSRDPGAMMTVTLSAVADPALTRTVTSPEGQAVEPDLAALRDGSLYFRLADGSGDAIQCPVGDDAYLTVRASPADAAVFDLTRAVVEALRTEAGASLDRCDVAAG